MNSVQGVALNTPWNGHSSCAATLTTSDKRERRDLQEKNTASDDDDDDCDDAVDDDDVLLTTMIMVLIMIMMLICFRARVGASPLNLYRCICTCVIIRAPNYVHIRIHSNFRAQARKPDLATC